MAKHTLEILRCGHPKIFKVCLAIFQHYQIKVEKESSKIILKYSKYQRYKAQSFPFSKSQPLEYQVSSVSTSKKRNCKHLRITSSDIQVVTCSKKK